MRGNRSIRDFSVGPRHVREFSFGPRAKVQCKKKMVVQSSAIYSTGIKESASCHCYGGRLQRLGLRVLIVSSVQVHRGNLRTQAATWPSTHGRAWMPRLHRGDRAGRARSAYPVGGSRSRGNEVVAVTVILKPDSAVRDAQSSRLRLRSVVGSKRTASPSRTEADPISKRRRVLQTSSSKVTATAMSVAARQSCDGMLTKRATKSLGCDRRQGSFSDVAEDLLMCDEVSPPSFINARKASDWSPALARNQEARCTQQQEGQTSYFAEHEDAVSCPEVCPMCMLVSAISLSCLKRSRSSVNLSKKLGCPRSIFALSIVELRQSILHRQASNMRIPNRNRLNRPCAQP